MDSLVLDPPPRLPDIVLTPNKNTPRRQLQLPISTQELIRRVRDSLIGEDTTFPTPFGLKKIVYADYTASGRLSTLVQSFLQANVGAPSLTQVYPLYANTHSNSSWGPIQTALYREQSRKLIKHSIGCGPQDALLFCGSGATCGANKLAAMLHQVYAAEPKLIVLLSKFEHHSNILPWREMARTEIRYIQLGSNGSFDYQHLEEVLKQLRLQHPQVPLIGSFTAASNLTGHYFDVDRIAYLCHLHGALVFIDYACAAPYLQINMNGPSKLGYTRSWLKKDCIGKFLKLCYKDGATISTHKFIGGPGSSGLLAIKANIVQGNPHPTFPGGGSVLYVNQEQHIYIKSVQDREEAGTPNILGDIKAGLAFKLKNSIGIKTIGALNERIMNIIRERTQTMKNVEFYGCMDHQRIPIFVFNIKVFGKFLHYNFVCSLLNDLFGIFSRGGCQCAGPYGHELLGVGLEQSHKIRDLLVSGFEIFKMGFSRINFCYLWEDQTINYVLDALDFISENGWMFLLKYVPNLATGQWQHINGMPNFTQRQSIKSLDILQETRPQKPDDLELSSITESISDVLRTLRLDYQRNGYHLKQSQRLKIPPESEEQQWFMTPEEARNHLINTGLGHLDLYVPESLEKEMIIRRNQVSPERSRLTSFHADSMQDLSTIPSLQSMHEGDELEQNFTLPARQLSPKRKSLFEMAKPRAFSNSRNSMVELLVRSPTEKRKVKLPMLKKTSVANLISPLSKPLGEVPIPLSMLKFKVKKPKKTLSRNKHCFSGGCLPLSNARP